ncbi:MAG: DUF4013 domain-containing protein [Thermofilaceae archaeon]
MSIQTRDVGEIASRSFGFMVKLTRDIGNLLLLIVLNVIPIINFIVLGYFVRVVRYDHDEPPKLGNYGGLFVEGLKLAIAILLYALIPLILLLVGGFGAGIFMFRFRWGFGILRGLFLLLVIVAVLLLVFIFFISLPALSLYMRTGDFGKIFAFGESWDLVKTFGLGNYIIFFIMLVVFNAIVAAIGSIIPWVGPMVLGVFSMAFTFKALSLFVNLKYPIPPPPPPPSPTHPTF